jgi:uncharacterized damage-inducible protein DinB
VNLDDLQTLLDYHYWARDRLLEAVDQLPPESLTRDMGNSFKSILDTLNHLYFAEWAWHERWNGRAPTGPPVANFTDATTLRAAWSDLEGNVRAFLDRLGPDGVVRVFEYKLLSGQPGASPFWHMLQHVVNHASYHRGQVTTMMRQLGAAPARPMDLIAFYRAR